MTKGVCLNEVSSRLKEALAGLTLCHMATAQLPEAQQSALGSGLHWVTEGVGGALELVELMRGMQK